jgi:hypothetical protein
MSASERKVQESKEPITQEANPAEEKAPAKEVPSQKTRGELFRLAEVIHACNDEIEAAFQQRVSNAPTHSKTNLEEKRLQHIEALTALVQTEKDLSAEDYTVLADLIYPQEWVKNPNNNWEKNNHCVPYYPLPLYLYLKAAQKGHAVAPINVWLLYTKMSSANSLFDSSEYVLNDSAFQNNLQWLYTFISRANHHVKNLYDGLLEMEIHRTFFADEKKYEEPSRARQVLYFHGLFLQQKLITEQWTRPTQEMLYWRGANLSQQLQIEQWLLPPHSLKFNEYFKKYPSAFEIFFAHEPAERQLTILNELPKQYRDLLIRDYKIQNSLPRFSEGGIEQLILDYAYEDNKNIAKESFQLVVSSFKDLLTFFSTSLSLEPYRRPWFAEVDRIEREVKIKTNGMETSDLKVEYKMAMTELLHFAADNVIRFGEDSDFNTLWKEAFAPVSHFYQLQADKIYKDEFHYRTNGIKKFIKEFCHMFSKLAPDEKASNDIIKIYNDFNLQGGTFFHMSHIYYDRFACKYECKKLIKLILAYQSAYKNRSLVFPKLEELMNKHRTLIEFFKKELSQDEEVKKEDAKKIEHFMSEFSDMLKPNKKSRDAWTFFSGIFSSDETDSYAWKVLKIQVKVINTSQDQMAQRAQFKKLLQLIFELDKTYQLPIGLFKKCKAVLEKHRKFVEPILIELKIFAERSTHAPGFRK